MGHRLTLARRLFMGLCALWAASAGSGPLVRGRSADPALRRAFERFLPLLGQAELSLPLLQAALQESFGCLPPSLREEIVAQAGAAGVSWQVAAAYNLAEALPLSARTLQQCLPRAIGFCLPRKDWQNGILALAFLPLAEEPTWREEGLLSGLAVGRRMGFHLAINGSLAALCLALEPARWLGPGVPGPAIIREALRIGRTLGDALAIARSLPPARLTACTFYDCVEGVGQVLLTGEAPSLEEPGRALLVQGVQGAEPNLAWLRRAVEANDGWLTARKAVQLLQQALPGACAVAIDADARVGLLAGHRGVQELIF